MLITTLLTLALAAPTPQGGLPTTTTAQAPAPIVGSRASRGGALPIQQPQVPSQPQGGSYGARLLRAGPGAQFATIVGGSYTRIGGQTLAVGAIPTHHVTQVIFGNTGTAFEESALIGVPTQPLANAPLLVMFHSYGVSEWDCYLNSPLFKLALDRGWYVVAPLGAHELNFGVPYSQDNIEYVLDFMLANFPIDAQRVYGAGFSMGGGGVTSYMARHFDPGHARFAAVVNHMGGVSIANTYWNSPPDQSILGHPQMFQGSPAQFPFAYSQASMIDLDHLDGTTINPNTDMARNAAHIPLLNFTVSQDPLAYLRAQVLALSTWMHTPPLSSVETHLEVIGTTHDWIHLDAVIALDFLRVHTLSTPRAGTHRVLADREAAWHHFYVYQDAPGAFTPFRWAMIDGLNRVVIDETQNLQRIVIDSASLGLHTAVPTEVMFGTQDGLPEEITLSGYPNMPLSVTRNGQVTNAWTYDAIAQSVTLMETNATNYPLWIVTP